ncbi:ABC transporter ATP-binding protein [Candidatus Woesebacteria bacterium]|nr:ABC transporter ATP-binding protein [Candidatus Woesebacteria bacterium]
MSKKPPAPASQYSVWAFISDLTALVKPYRLQFLAGAFLRLTSDIANWYPAWALSRLVLLLSQTGTSDALASAVTFLLAGWFIAVIYYSIAHASAKLFGYQVSERVALDVRFRALQHIFSLDISWQEKENTGNKLKRIDHGSRSLDRIIRIFFDVIVEATLNSVGMFFIFLTLGWELGVALIVFMIYYFALSSVLTKKASEQAYIVNKIEEDLEGLSFESLNNIRTVKALSIQKTVLGTLFDVTERTFAAVRKRIILFRIRSGTLHLSYLIFEVSMICYIVWQILEGRFTPDVLILFVGYFGKVEAAISELAEVSHEIVIGKVQFHRLLSILSTKPNIEGTKQEKQLKMPKNWQTIEFKNVCFSYEDKAVLENFNLIIERGKKIGIVGLSGAGKSTLFSLLMDLYETYDGEILVDGFSLKDIDRQDYVNHLAVVLQDTELFNVSLADNILIGRQPGKTVDKNQLTEAIKNAHLSQVIDRLPKGADTVIGEKGVKLSGGEKQRLGIARALYRQPELLLMDEATSHLDVESEKKIQASLHEFFNKVTAVVIAHRLSTIKEMDIILVMQRGQIVEQGSFSELLNDKGVFARLWEQQKL